MTQLLSCLDNWSNALFACAGIATVINAPPQTADAIAVRVNLEIRGHLRIKAYLPAPRSFSQAITSFIA